MLSRAKIMKNIFACGATALSFGLAVGCAGTAPTRELADARAAYQKASMSRAADDAPAELLTAKQTLELAEKAHENDPGSGIEKQLAYLAERHAKLAMAQSDIVVADRSRSQAENDYVSYQETARESLEQELQRARNEIADIRNQMVSQQTAGEIQRLQQRQTDLEARRAELESQLTGQQTQLNQAQQAQAVAEQRIKGLEELKSVGNVRREQGDTVLTLAGQVIFRPSDNSLLPIARQSLSRVAEVLKNQNDKTLVIEGHADARGPAHANDELSLMRAESVRSYLIEQGIDPSKITAVGRGEREPIASNATPEGRANNRRVEIIIRDNQQTPAEAPTG